MDTDTIDYEVNGKKLKFVPIRMDVTYDLTSFLKSERIKEIRQSNLSKELEIELILKVINNTIKEEEKQEFLSSPEGIMYIVWKNLSESMTITLKETYKLFSAGIEGLKQLQDVFNLINGISGLNIELDEKKVEEALKKNQIKE